MFQSEMGRKMALLATPSYFELDQVEMDQQQVFFRYTLIFSSSVSQKWVEKSLY